MARLVLVDTADQLPGLLPIHAWSALMSSELVLVGSPDHPFLPHLDLAELRFEVVAEGAGGAALSRADLLSGLTPSDKRRAEHVVDRVRAEGEAVYLFGPADAEAFTRVLGMEAARAGVEVEVVYFGLKPKGATLLELVEVEARLRGPGGCAWDREQTHASLGRYAVEEVYELLEAIASGDPAAVREELGDVLLQVVFHAQIADDADDFTIDDVARGIVDKLVRRHPHVFSRPDSAAAGPSAQEVAGNWEILKAEEKPERSGVFDGVPAAQPALQYLVKLQSRAAKAGLAGPDDPADLRGALEAFLAAPDTAALGDVLAPLVDVARRHDVDAEAALRDAARRFRQRVEAAVERRVV